MRKKRQTIRRTHDKIQRKKYFETSYLLSGNTIFTISYYLNFRKMPFARF